MEENKVKQSGATKGQGYGECQMSGYMFSAHSKPLSPALRLLLRRKGTTSTEGEPKPKKSRGKAKPETSEPEAREPDSQDEASNCDQESDEEARPKARPKGKAKAKSKAKAKAKAGGKKSK